MARTRPDLIEKEIERLEEQATLLERDWKRLPYLWGGMLLVGPIWLIWGPVVGLYALLCVPCLFFTALYLVGVRRSENRQMLAEMRRQLERMRGPEARPAA